MNLATPFAPTRLAAASSRSPRVRRIVLAAFAVCIGALAACSADGVSGAPSAIGNDASTAADQEPVGGGDGGKNEAGKGDGGKKDASSLSDSGSKADSSLGAFSCNLMTGGGCPNGDVCAGAAATYPKVPEVTPTSLILTCVAPTKAKQGLGDECSGSQHCAAGLVCWGVLDACFPVCDFYSGGTPDPSEPNFRLSHPDCPPSAETCVRNWAGLGHCDNVGSIP